MNAGTRSSSRRDQDYNPFDNMNGFSFTFRDPDEVFREFFGGASPFDMFFPGKQPPNFTRDHVRLTFAVTKQ